MANAIIETDLAVLHEQIGAKLSEAFPAFQVVEFYREEDERAPLKEAQLPALLLEMSELEPDLESDPGTEQLPAIARFEARIVVGFRTAQAKVEVRKLASAVAAFMHKNKRFYGKGGPVTVDAIVADDFYPELDRFEVWRLDFSIRVWLGETVWTNDGITPLQPVYSWVPNIGIGNEDKYEDSATNGI